MKSEKIQRNLRNFKEIWGHSKKSKKIQENLRKSRENPKKFKEI